MSDLLYKVKDKVERTSNFTMYRQPEQKVDGVDEYILAHLYIGVLRFMSSAAGKCIMSPKVDQLRQWSTCTL